MERVVFSSAPTLKTVNYAKSATEQEWNQTKIIKTMSIKVESFITDEPNEITESDLPCLAVDAPNTVYLLTRQGIGMFQLLDNEGDINKYTDFNDLVIDLFKAPKGTTFTITQE